MSIRYFALANTNFQDHNVRLSVCMPLCMHAYVHKYTRQVYKVIVSEVSSSNEINAPLSVYIIYIYIVRTQPFGPAGGAKCKMVSTRKRKQLVEVQRSS